MDSYMASNGSRLMVPWIIFKNHLLEVGLTQKLGDHDTPNTHSRWFILLYHAWGHAWIKIHWNSIWLRAQSHMAYTTLAGPRPHYMILEVCWDGLWTLSLGLSHSYGHGLQSQSGVRARPLFLTIVAFCDCLLHIRMMIWPMPNLCPQPACSWLSQWTHIRSEYI
jgi:hypothetical protein